jgi:carbamoyl-phosphate synthase large subunit
MELVSNQSQIPIGLAKLVRTGGQSTSSDRVARMMISSAGRRVGLLRCFAESASALGVDLQIVACDLQPEWSAACMLADKAFAAPPAESAGFIPAMLDLCEREGIGLVVPTIDTELVAYSEAREAFAAIGTQVVVSAAPLVGMARDKLATARFLEAAGLASPGTADAKEFVQGRSNLCFPLLAKPRHGSSSRGIETVMTRAQVSALASREAYVVQEYLAGRELTVGLYFDLAGKLRCAVAHERLKVRAGEVEKGVTIRIPELERMARGLGAVLEGARGPLCFQVRLDFDGAPSIFEINARFGGGYPLAHRAGATFTRWILEEWLDLSCTANNEWSEGVVMLRFDDGVFV